MSTKSAKSGRIHAGARARVLPARGQCNHRARNRASAYQVARDMASTRPIGHSLRGTASRYQHVYELMHRRRLQALTVHAEIEYRRLLFRGIAAGEIHLEFPEQKRNAVFTPARVAQREFDAHLGRLR